MRSDHGSAAFAPNELNMVEVMDVPGANKSRNDAELEVVEIESAVLTLPTEVALEAQREN